ncbi:MAG: hypothetical protein R3F30_07340 [Planctomycetota bacterium]
MLLGATASLQAQDEAPDPLDTIKARAILQERPVLLVVDGVDQAARGLLHEALADPAVRKELERTLFLHGDPLAPEGSAERRAYEAIIGRICGNPPGYDRPQQFVLHMDGSIAWHGIGEVDADTLAGQLRAAHKAVHAGEQRRYKALAADLRAQLARLGKDSEAGYRLMVLMRNAPAGRFADLFDELRGETALRVLEEVATLPLDRARHLLGTVAEHDRAEVRAFVRALLWALELGGGDRVSAAAGQR